VGYQHQRVAAGQQLLRSTTCAFWPREVGMAEHAAQASAAEFGPPAPRAPGAPADCSQMDSFMRWIMVDFF
jgi:hypothetical protein